MQKKDLTADEIIKYGVSRIKHRPSSYWVMDSFIEKIGILK